jgi:hypothetical protein
MITTIIDYTINTTIVTMIITIITTIVTTIMLDDMIVSQACCKLQLKEYPVPPRHSLGTVRATPVFMLTFAVSMTSWQSL